MVGTGTTLLVDSDAFLALAGADSLDDALALLSLHPDVVRRLDPLSHMLRRGRGSIIRQWSPDARDRALSACVRIAGLAYEPDPHVVQRFATARGVDLGEALLFATLAERPTYLLTTGDKRALVALCQTPELADLREGVAGRVICLESILRGLVLRHGAGEIGPRFRGITTHQTLRVIFSEGNIVDQDLCLAAIDQYLDDLKRQVGEAFLYEL